ncbi:MAG: acyl-CoA dehydrogenase family protein [Burkholderiales bacterium]
MDFQDTPREAEFRAKARAWIAVNAPQELHDELARAPFGHIDLVGRSALAASKDWHRRKAAGGWACLTWPRDYGGQGASAIDNVIWHQEEGVYSKLAGPFMVAQGSFGPTLIAWGSEAQKQVHLPRIVAGEEVWCQLFSEPGAGSDLAGVRTRAVPDGEGWLINGQKMWSSGAHEADFGVLLVRTNPDVPKHKGLTMFLLDMHAPGVEVRPIRQITNQSHVNEVYMTDVRLADAHRLGPVDKGWQVALTMLMNERNSIGNQMQTGFEEVFSLAARLPQGDGVALDDPAVVSRLAELAARANGLKYTNYRIQTALSQGDEPGPELSIMKLVAASTMQEAAMFALDLQGPAGMVMDMTEDGDDLFQMMLLRSAGARIEGGTDEIMRTIIAERVLGLPQDMRADKDVPFSAIPTA